jgi:hypothetical protein
MAREEAKTALDKSTNEANIAIAAGRTETEKATAEAVKARAEADKAIAEAVRINARAAELEGEVAKARNEKEELKANLGWRALPAAVVAQLIDTLAAKPSQVTIQYTNGDTEALYFALQMSNIFAKCKLAGHYGRGGGARHNHIWRFCARHSYTINYHHP